jgi:hypothetical protein
MFIMSVPAEEERDMLLRYEVNFILLLVPALWEKILPTKSSTNTIPVATKDHGRAVLLCRKGHFALLISSICGRLVC